MLVLGAVFVGLIGAAAWQWSSSGPPAKVDTSAIEWNAVAAPRTRAPDAEDVAWEKRAEEADGPSATQDMGTADPGQSVRVRRGSGRTASAVTASFTYCKWGGGTNCVVDGDTFWIGGEKVRIAGIDAPETHPPRCPYEAQLGDAATVKLHELLNRGAVTMSSIDRDRDRYGRLLRNVQVDGQDVGEAMIAAGVAREYAGGRRPWC
jgi:micrococcal nuclease